MAIDVVGVEAPTGVLPRQENNNPTNNNRGANTVEGGITFDRNLFINQEGSESGQEVTFSAETQGKYKAFLENYVQKLSNFRTRYGEARFNEVLANPEHAYDKMLFDQMSSHLRNHETGERGEFKVNKQAVASFLQDSKGWEIATSLMEHQTAMQFHALGLYAANMPAGERQRLAEQLTIRLGREYGQGVLNRIWFDRIVPNADRITRYAGGAIASAITALNFGATFGPIGMGTTAAVAMGTGALLAGGEAFVRAIRDGDMVQLRECEGAFNAIANSPEESDYVKEIHGIDVNDFEFRSPIAGAPRRLGLARNWITESTNIAKVQDALVGNLRTRKQWYNALNVPIPDAIPGQYLSRYDTGNQEQTGEWRLQRFQDLFQPNNGGILDLTGRDPTDPNFDRNRLDYAGNITRFFEAQRNVMVEMINTKIAAERMRRTTPESGPAAIREKIGERKVRFTRELTQQRDALDTRNTELTTQQRLIDTWQQARNAPNEAMQNFRREFPAVADIPTAIVDARTNLTNAQTDLNALRTGRSTEISNRVNTIVTGLAPLNVTGMNAREENDARAARRNEIAQIRRDVTTEVDADITQRTEIVEERTRQLARLNELQAGAQAYTNGIEAAETGVLATARENIPGMIADLDTLTGPPPGWGLPEATVRTGTLAEVLQAINAQNAADAAAGIPVANRRGWPEADNNTPANRDRTLRAMTESRARFEEGRDARSIGRQLNFTTIRGWGVAENELLTFSNNALLDAINGINAANPAFGWPDTENLLPGRQQELQNAVNEARSRMLYRNRFHTQLQSADVATRLEAANRRLEAENLNREFENLPEIIQANLTLDAMRNEADTLSRAYETTVSERNVATFFNENTLAAVAIVDPDAVAEYSQAEQDANYPQGYYELMQMMFGYQDKNNREEYFRRLEQTIPPQRLSDHLIRELGLVGVGVGTPLNRVLMEIRLATGDPATRTVYGPDVSAAFQLLIYRMKRQALAL